MKIDLGNNSYLEPDPEPRESPFHKRIVAFKHIDGTMVGHVLKLECGHQVLTFGRLEHAAGIVLCTVCRDAAK